jgi:sugar phosphate isomerase/epimerase
MFLSTQTDVCARALGYPGAVRFLAEAGFDAVDFSFFQPQAEGFFDLPRESMLDFAAEIRAAAAESGIFVNQTHAPYSFPPEMWDDWERNIVPIVSDALLVSGAMGADTVIVHPAQYLNHQRNAELLYEINLRYYNLLRPVAETAGVRIAVENMWQYNVNRKVIGPSVCASPAEFCAMLDDLNSPVFTACLDVGHCGLAGWRAEELVRALGHDRLGALHVHDNDHMHDSHTLPGLGLIDWTEFCRALGEIDYAGVFTFEADRFFQTVLDTSLYPAAAKLLERTGRYLVSLTDSFRPEA